MTPRKKPEDKPKMGRPTLYDPKYCDDIITYFDIEPFVLVEKEVVKKDGTVELKEVKEPVSLPTLAGFAVKLKVCKDTLNEWSRQHKDFSAAIKKAKACQERILLENGLNGGYDKVMSIFALKNLADWKDRTEQAITGHDGGELKTTLTIKFEAPPDSK